MKTLKKILFCLAPFAVFALARAEESSAGVVTMSAVVVEATRVADPLATMQATLASRTHLSVPKRVNVRLEPYSRLARAEANRINPSAPVLKTPPPAPRLF